MCLVFVRIQSLKCVLTIKIQLSYLNRIKSDNENLSSIPMDGSSLLGFFQLNVIVLPVTDSITGVPSGGSGRISEHDEDRIRGP